MEDLVAKEEKSLAAAQSRGYHLICPLTHSHHKRGISSQPQPELGDMTRLAVSDRGLATTKGRSMSAGASIRTLEKENEEY
jgi:hypothetical protein